MGDQNVTMTATITLNGETRTKTFTVKVPALRLVPAVAQFKFEGDLSDAKGKFAAAKPTGDRSNNTGGTAVYVDGVDGKAINLNGTYGVLLPDSIISSYKYTVSYWLKPAAKTWFTSSFFASVNDGADWISLPLETWWDQTFKVWHISNVAGKGDAWCASGVAMELNKWSQITLSVDSGLATVYLDGVKKCTVGGIVDLFSANTGKFAIGVNPWDLPYNGLVDDFKVYNTVLTPDDVALRDPGSKPAQEVLALAKAELSLGNISALKDDIDLPLAGPYTVAISWKSLNTKALSDIGVVTQPSATESDATVTLVATLTYGGSSTTKEFTATVKSKAPPAPVAEFLFEDNLAEKSGKFDSGVVVGNRVNVNGGNVTYTAGAEGKALVLDGNSGVVLPDNLIKDHSYAISLWLNPTALTQFTTAFFGYATDSSWISLVPGGGPGGTTQSLLWSGTAWFDGLLGSKIPVGAWTHIIMVVDNGKFTAYLNGKAVPSVGGAFPDVFTPAARHFALGVNFWDTPYNGKIDQLKIYDDALSADDAAVVYAKSIAK